ncbi:MAG: hypothetical protein WAO98_00570 [Alphaproteobacteria bacterium]
MDIWASPGHLVCFSHDQLKGTLIHEAGHFADPLYQRASQQAVLQEFFLLGAAAAVAICTLNLLFTRKNERPHPTLNKIGGFALAGFLLTHSINGAWLLEQRIKLEKRADHFTAVKMGSGEALAGSIEILQTMNDDGLAKNKKPNYLIRAATYFEDWYVFGIAGFCGDVCMHPPAQERINVLRAYKPRKPLPTASNERASHMVLN